MFVCLWRTERFEVTAPTAFKAQEELRVYLQEKYPKCKIKSHEINVNPAHLQE